MGASQQSNPDARPFQADISTLDTLKLVAIRSTDPRATKKKWISFAIRAAFTALLFAFLFKTLSWSALLHILAHVQSAVLVIGLAVGAFGIVVSSFQWRSLLQGERIHAGILKLISLYLVGIAFSHFLPTGMGGDAVKAFYVGRASGNNAGSVSAVVMSRVTGFFGMLFVAFITLLIWHAYFNRNVVILFLLLSLLVGSMIGAALFSATLLSRILKGDWAKRRVGHYRIFGTAIRLGNTLSSTMKRPRSLITATWFGLLFWVVGCLNYYSYAAALQMKVPLYFYFVSVPLVSLVAFLPIAINGFGLREGALVYVFSTAHVPIATSLLLAFLMDFQVLLFGVIGGCIYLTMGSKSKSAKGRGVVWPELAMANESKQFPHHVETSSHELSRSSSFEHLDAARFTMNDHDQSNAGTPQLDSNSASGDEITLRVRTVRPPTTTPVSTPGLASEKEQGGLATPIPPNPEREAEKQSAPLSTDSKEKQSSAVSPPVSPPRSTSDLRRSRGWRKKRVVVVGAVISMLVLLGAGGFYAWRLLKADQNVTVYQVGVQNATQDVGGAGIVFPLQQVDISYPVVERAIAVFVKAGDQVSPKQPLIQLDTAQLNAELVKAADDLAAASVYLNSVSATGNPVTIAQAQQAYDFAKNKYEALVAETSSPLLQNGALIAPMKGVVTAVNINAGEVIAANTTLITIMDESSVIVHAEVPLSNLGQVHLGQQATVTPSALPNLNFPGKVTAIIPQANSQTDTFEVWVEVNNPDKMLLPGMSAFVRLQSQVRALVVPRLAVLNPDRESVVFIVRNQRAYMQHVHVVGRSINALYIDRGLSAGDEVVLVGVYKLQTGQKVLVTDVEDKIS